MKTASELLSAVQQAEKEGQPASPVTVLWQPDGGLHLVMESDWSVEALRMDRGAEAACRVEQRGSQIRVEGASATEHCVFTVGRAENRLKEAALAEPGYLVEPATALPPRRPLYDAAIEEDD